MMTASSEGAAVAACAGTTRVEDSSAIEAPTAVRREENVMVMSFGGSDVGMMPGTR
ncbi:hypothetical protein ACFFX0_22645 [Citricoccus parietis]|uniref:Uncharacterized protein n=1 Tax=Citricoccus parietis TaxID=592307 RepID=A0ABV5G5W9_9MICC